MNIIIVSKQDFPMFGLNIYLLACSETMHNKNDSTKVRDKSFKPTVRQQYACRVRAIHFFLKMFCILCKIAFFLLCLLIFFPNKFFLKATFRNTIKVSISLDPDQARRYVGPYLYPNCLQISSANVAELKKALITYINSAKHCQK